MLITNNCVSTLYYIWIYTSTTSISHHMYKEGSLLSNDILKSFYLQLYLQACGEPAAATTMGYSLHHDRTFCHKQNKMYMSLDGSPIQFFIHNSSKKE